MATSRSPIIKLPILAPVHSIPDFAVSFDGPASLSTGISRLGGGVSLNYPGDNLLKEQVLVILITLVRKRH